MPILEFNCEKCGYKFDRMVQGGGQAGSSVSAGAEFRGCDR